MKRIIHTTRSKDHLLHIETDLGIINIRVGLTDEEGHRVESISILPDDYSEREHVKVDSAGTHVRFIEKLSK